jgi:hypothetical protein
MDNFGWLTYRISKVTLRHLKKAFTPMPNRTKHEAEVRLSLGVARIAMRQGKTPQEAVQAVKDHIAVTRSLDRPNAGATEDERPSLKKCCAD